MDDAKQQLVDKLKTANNILVTVSRNPSVDQLASCLGLTLLLNKQGKHTAAVFSGEVPSTLEFLQPEDTIEKNTDSLRDFIIALDKSKADKLRYKVEDNVVRIFITPYKTSISEADLDFSQGDFNVDVVVALGVAQQEDLDEAITAHGRILHDATVTTINVSTGSGLGTINWNDPQASSLSELVTELVQSLDANLLDSQIATALLTGIVSETDRFSNDKTSSQTMSISSALMAAGANQQLVASKLEEPEQPPLAQQNDVDVEPHKADDGMIEINHDDDEVAAEKTDTAPEVPSESPSLDTSDTSEEPESKPEPAPEEKAEEQPQEPLASSIELGGNSKLVTDPPTLGGTLTANSNPEPLDPANDPLGLPNTEPPMLEHNADTTDASAPSPYEPPVPGITPPPPIWTPPATDNVPSQPSASPYSTLADLEVASQTAAIAPETVDTARGEVSRALSSDAAGIEAEATREPIEALNAQPLGAGLHPSDSPTPTAPSDDVTAASPAGPVSATDDTASAEAVPDSNIPPPVPPPIPFQFGTPPPQP